MENITNIPEWLGNAAIGAIIAALGYVLKLLLDWITGWRSRIRARRASLVELYSTLKAGEIAYIVQCKIRNRLKEAIAERNPAYKNYQEGYEQLFTIFFPDMNTKELELHSLIRAYTIHTIKTLNDRLLTWIKSDIYYKSKQNGKGIKSELAKDIILLEAHLLLWQAKYEIWIPDRHDHSLVYLADEQKNGLGFPTEITDKIETILKWDNLTRARSDNSG